VILLFLLPGLSPNVGGAVNDGGRGKGAWGANGARGRSGVLISRPIVIVLPPCDSPVGISYITALITFYVILELLLVPCFFAVKDTAKARLGRCPIARKPVTRLQRARARQRGA
jgi:hypothetical protein